MARFQKVNTGFLEIQNRGFWVNYLAFICRATNYSVQCYMRTPPVSQTVYYFEMKLGPLVSAKNPGGTCFEASSLSGGLCCIPSSQLAFPYLTLFAYITPPPIQYEHRR